MGLGLGCHHGHIFGSSWATMYQLSISGIDGELLQIDTTSLVIAGFQSSAIWMLPTLAGAPGTAAFYLKTRKN